MVEEAGRASGPEKSRARRLAECAAFVAAYIALGYALPVDANGYLLLGIPLTAGGVAVLMMLLGALGELVPRPLAEMLKIGGESFLLYLPIVFLIEEVTFRGVVDPHAHHPGEPHGIWTAVFVSALWGLWHLPIAEPGSFALTVGQLLLLHIPTGVFLSHYWRKSGNLLVPGVPHAFMDSVRNAICSQII